MRSTSETKRSAPWLRLVFVLLLAAIPATQLACVEFVHWGHISDRENTWGINGVQIEQKQPDGSWRKIGETDGKGRWEVFKKDVHGGGTIRVSKRGYYTIEMTEAEFMQKNMILMQETGSGDVGEGLPPDWME